MGDDDVLNVSIMSKTIQLRPSDDNIGDKSFPLVFKCAKCSQIIGDSISWVCSNEDLRAITLMRMNFELFVKFIKPNTDELFLPADGLW